MATVYKRSFTPFRMTSRMIVILSEAQRNEESNRMFLIDKRMLIIKFGTNQFVTEIVKNYTAGGSVCRLAVSIFFHSDVDRDSYGMIF
jgi:hypothetical protein